MYPTKLKGGREREREIINKKKNVKEDGKNEEEAKKKNV